jgi:hypothetical protein
VGQHILRRRRTYPQVAWERYALSISTRSVAVSLPWVLRAMYRVLVAIQTRCRRIEIPAIAASVSHALRLTTLAPCTQGRLTPLNSTPVGPNPAFIIRHPTLPNLLYATTECILGDGELLTLELNREQGRLEVLARQSAVRHTPRPCPRPTGHRNFISNHHSLYRTRRDNPHAFVTFIVTTTFPPSEPASMCINHDCASVWFGCGRRRALKSARWTRVGGATPAGLNASLDIDSLSTSIP